MLQWLILMIITTYVIILKDDTAILFATLPKRCVPHCQATIDDDDDDNDVDDVDDDDDDDIGGDDDNDDENINSAKRDAFFEHLKFIEWLNLLREKGCIINRYIW